MSSSHLECIFVGLLGFQLSAGLNGNRNGDFMSRCIESKQILSI